MPKKYIFIALLVLLPAGFILFNTLFSNKPDMPKIASGKFDETKLVGNFHGQVYDVPKYESASLSSIDLLEKTDVLGSKKKKGEKRIEVDLTNQKLYAYQGDDKEYEFDVSTGKWGLTPTGEFRIWYKLKYATMAGGSQALGTYYYLPNVPFTMYFHQGYGIHGTYWHDNFGHPMSHGCVNMRTEEAEKIFYWANPSLAEGVDSVMSSDDNQGTKVIVYGDTPNE